MKVSDLRTELVALRDGSLAYPYEYEGETVLVRCDALSAIKLYELLRDESRSSRSKDDDVLNLVFADPEAAFFACDYSAVALVELAQKVVWEVFGFDTGNGRTEEPLFDLREDADHIRASLRMAYGIDWDASRSLMSFSEFTALIGGLSMQTPLGMRIHYRNKKNRPKGKGKFVREQQREFDRLNRLFALHGNTRGSQNRIEAATRSMDDLAMALMARSG